MVEEGASERLDKILIEGRDSISREDLLKYTRSNFEEQEQNPEEHQMGRRKE